MKEYWKLSQMKSDNNIIYSIYIYIDIIVCKILYSSYLDDYILFDFSKFNHFYKNNFITYKKQLKFWSHFNSPEAVNSFEDKFIFNNIFCDFINRKYMLVNSFTTEKDILLFINNAKNVIIKPIKGICGKGIYKLDHSNDNELRQFIDSAKKNIYIIEEFIENEDTLKKLNPSSLNTIRVVTCIDKNNKTHIIKTVLRIGTTSSCVDNVHSGGIVCSINTEFGIVDSYAYDRAGNKYIKHPVSNIIIMGFKIPHWENLKPYIETITHIKPEARYVGWDIAITNMGFELIEGNTHHAADVLQMCDQTGKYKQVLSYL